MASPPSDCPTMPDTADRGTNRATNRCTGTGATPISASRRSCREICGTKATAKRHKATAPNTAHSSAITGTRGIAATNWLIMLESVTAASSRFGDKNSLVFRLGILSGTAASISPAATLTTIARINRRKSFHRNARSRHCRHIINKKEKIAGPISQTPIMRSLATVRASSTPPPARWIHCLDDAPDDKAHSQKQRIHGKTVQVP